MQKFLFLDIDGVLNTDKFQQALKKEGKPLGDKNGFFFFDPDAVCNLEKILSASQARICLISSWSNFGIGQIKDLWKERKMPGSIYKICRSNPFDIVNMDLEKNGPIKLKSISIADFLNSRTEPCEYVIIDDESGFSPEQEKHHVQTDPALGICDADVAKSLQILMNGADIP